MIKKIKKYYNRFETEILFLFIASVLIAVLFAQIFINKKIYLYNDVASDTIDAYLPFITYFTESLRNLSLSSYDFMMGMGSSIFSIPHFLFDPFIPVIIVFGKINIIDGIFLVTILKIITIGMLFTQVLKRFFKENKLIVLGALIYSFSGYFLVWGQHYHFLTNGLYFTFLLFAFERWYENRNKKILLIIAIGTNFIFSLYFSYMTFLFIPFYIIGRYLIDSHKMEKIGNYFLSVIKVGIPGLLIGMFSALPQLYLLLDSPRTQDIIGANEFFIPFSKSFYATMISRFFSDSILGPNNQGLYFGYGNIYHLVIHTSIVLALLFPLIFFIKKRKIALGAAILVIFSLLLPFASLIFNKLSVIEFRWSYVLIPIAVFYIIYLLNFFANNQVESNRKKYIFILTVSFFVSTLALLYAKLVLVFENINFIFILSIFVLYYLTFMVYCWKPFGKERLFTIIIILFMAETIISSQNTLIINRSYFERNYLTQGQGYYEKDTNEAIQDIVKNDKSFYRLEKNYMLRFLNDSLVLGYRGFNSYNSLAPAGYVKINEALSHREYSRWRTVITGIAYDNYLQSIMAKKYALIKGDQEPYGYDKINEYGDVKVFKNLNPLPPVLVFDQVLAENKFLDLDFFRRKELLYDTVVLNDITNMDYLVKDTVGAIKDTQLETRIFVDEKQISNEEKISIGANDLEIRVKLKEPLSYGYLEIDIPYEPSKGSRYGLVGVVLEDGSIKDTNKEVIYFNDDISSEKIFMNLDYKNIKEVVISISRFSDSGNGLSIDGIRLYSKNVNRFEEALSRLKSNSSFQETENTKKSITGKLNVENDGIAVISIPYDLGWKVYVDGIKQKTFQANIGLIGFIVDEGEYDLEIRYEHPYFKTGLYLSGIGFIWVIFIYFNDRKNKNLTY